MTNLDRITATEVRVIAAGIVTTTAVSLPVFFVGALAVLMRADIPLPETRLGLAVTAYFGGSSLSSIVAGHAAHRFGSRPVVLVGASGAVVALGGLAAVAGSFWSVVAFMAIAGVSNSVAQLGVNLSLARDVRRGRQGLAFGIKQAAVPLASMVAGVGVPVLGVTMGWRTVFAVGAGVALAVVAAAVHRPSRARPLRARRSVVRPTGAAATDRPGERRRLPARIPRRVLTVVTLASFLASTAIIAMTTFLVSSATEAGLSPGSAGLLLAVSSLVCVLARLVAGSLVDRRQSRGLTAVAVLLAAGAVGVAMLATGSPRLLIPGAVIGFGCGWAWPGVMDFSVARLNPAAPTVALGIMLAGGFAGSAIGPPVFGLLVERASYAVAWTVAATAMLVGASLVFLASRWALRPKGAQAAGSGRCRAA